MSSRSLPRDEVRSFGAWPIAKTTTSAGMSVNSSANCGEKRPDSSKTDRQDCRRMPVTLPSSSRTAFGPHEQFSDDALVDASSISHG